MQHTSPARRSSALLVRIPALLAAATTIPLAVVGAARPAGASVAGTGPGIFNATAYGAVCDGTVHPGPDGRTMDFDAIQKAILFAEQDPRGATVVLPRGRCVIQAALDVSVGHPVTIEGTVGTGGSLETTVTDPINPSQASGDLDVLNSGNTLKDVIFDQLAFGQAAYVRGDHNLIEHVELLGGPKAFVLSVVGTPGNGPFGVGNELVDSQVVSLVDRTVYGAGPACDDGIEWAHQDRSLIRNVVFTGTRLALYQDTNSTVDGYTYYPGPQTCGLDGYEITQPSANITLEHLAMYGSGGTLGNPSPDPGVDRNIVVSDETVEPPVAGSGYRLAGPIHGMVINNVSGVTVNDSHFDSGGPNSQVEFAPSGAADGVTIADSVLTQVRFIGSNIPSLNGSTNGAQFKDDTFPAYNGTTSPVPDTFVSISGEPASFAVRGGVWRNGASTGTSQTVPSGFLRGKATFTVTGLAGY